jgi:hypothetical protein
MNTSLNLWKHVAMSYKEPDNRQVRADKMEPGEKLQRAYYEGYLQAVQKYRKEPVDFTFIPRLRQIIANQPQTEYHKLVLDHLDDAANENLTLVGRERHFDIAGSIVWNHMNVTEPSITEYIYIFQEAGGI